MNSRSKNDPSYFEDPALKSVIAQAWNSEKAPASLRNRVRRIVSGAPKLPAIRKTLRVPLTRPT